MHLVEFYRNAGVPNIYGTTFPAPKASSAPDRDMRSPEPNRLVSRFDPASESIIAEFTTPIEESVEVELFDLLGNRIDRLTSYPGDRTARFAASELRSGTYLVRARSAGTCCSHSISHVLR